MKDSRPWVALVGAAVIGCIAWTQRHAHAEAEPELLLRNGRRWNFRPVGDAGEPYPDWLRDLKGQSGVYVIRQRDEQGRPIVVYVGQSQTQLYDTLTRHLQQWTRWKRFWRGQYGGTDHDPGLTYPRRSVEVAVRLVPADQALDLEAKTIRRLAPRDNLIGQAPPETDEPLPF